MDFKDTEIRRLKQQNDSLSVVMQAYYEQMQEARRWAQAWKRAAKKYKTSLPHRMKINP